jgi:DNA polymerase-1
MAKLAIVDGHSILNRAFHALPLLTTRDGQPTNAVYGFLMSFLKFCDEVRPTHALVALDRPGPTFRHERYDAYKGHRPEADEQFVRQLPVFEAVLDALAVPYFGRPGVEADDIIGTLVRLAKADGFETVILTGDRDLLQLVDDGVTVYLARGVDRLVPYDRAAVVADLGVAPEQIPDLKGLTGDASDNIPGVAGIGPKGAQALLAVRPSLEALLAEPDAIPEGRAKRLLLAARDTALLSKELATIRTDVDLPFRPQDLTLALRRTPEVRQLFDRLEFRSLAERLRLPEAVASSPTPEPVPWSGAAFWPTADGLLCCDGRGTARIPWAEAGRALTAPGEKCVYDLKGFLHRAWAHGVEPGGAWFDPLIAAYLLHPQAERYPFEEICRQYLGEVPAADDDARVRALYRLRPVLGAEIEGQALGRLLHEVELPLAEVLARMEENGVAVDVGVLRAMGETLAREIEAVEAEIYALAGERFNINSTPQLRRVLFESLKLPVVKRTKTGPSTDAEVLEQLAASHAVVERILHYRQLQKLKSTYVDGLVPLVGPDGKIHTTFHQTVASTGRLSSSDPNLQNIPVRLEMGRLLRKAFVPSRSGYLLVACDYSQIELRILAHLSGDEGLKAAFASGVDIHTETAAEVFGLAPAAVGPEERRRAKAVNFGIVYGISDYGLARDLGISVHEAGEIIRRYFERFPGVRAYLDRQVAFAREFGYVETMLGRRRPLPDIHHRNRQARAFAERMAMNTPIQGSAADLIKLAMVRLYADLSASRQTDRLLLQVHDELILEAPADEAEAMGRQVAETMARAYPLSVPVEVEVKIGPSWYDVRPVATLA